MNVLKRRFLMVIMAMAVTIEGYAGQIGVSNNPSALEKRAAIELQHFLQKISNTSYQIVPENTVTDKNAIYLGQTKFAATHNIDFASADKEEWIVKTVGDHMVVSGGRPAGTLYGVYALLQKLGCYFLTSDETVIPTITPLILPEMNERKKPFFAGRNAYDRYQTVFTRRQISLDNYWLFRLRNRVNGGQGRSRKGVLYTGDMFRLSYNMPNYHNFFNYVSRKKYFKTHPEYFNMNASGKRFMKMGQGSQL